MMKQCSDLNGPQKARGFKNMTPVKDTRPVHVIGKQQLSSQQSADWSVMDERLTDDFTLPKGIVEQVTWMLYIGRVASLLM